MLINWLHHLRPKAELTTICIHPEYHGNHIIVPISIGLFTIILDYVFHFPSRTSQSRWQCLHNDKSQKWKSRKSRNQNHYEDLVVSNRGWRRTGARRLQTQCIWLNNEAQVMAKPNNIDGDTQTQAHQIKPDSSWIQGETHGKEAKVEW